jgi:hypothetical protein
MRVGGTAWSRGTRAAIPGAACVPAQRAPVGRRAIARGAWATSLPTKTCGAASLTPDWPDRARGGLYGAGQLCGLWEDRTRHPRLRGGLSGPRLSRSRTSADWVTGLRPRHPGKRQGCKASLASRGSAGMPSDLDAVSVVFSRLGVARRLTAPLHQPIGSPCLPVREATRAW